MPSTTSSSVVRLLASSTVITPSLPTFCIASASMRPTSASPFEEIVPTWAISSEVVTFFERDCRSLTTASTARSTPRLRSIGFMPAATDLPPSRTIAAARMVAVVVPSPAISFCFEATSRTICAPMFSNLSESSISLATVTPSLVMRGAPKLFSITTLRPLGPSVTFTALARISTPRSIFSRASAENLTSFAAIVSLLKRHDLHFRPRSGGLPLGRDLIEHAHDVGLLHDQEILPIDAHLGARPLPEQHPVADLHVERLNPAALVACAGADGNHLTLLGLFLSRIGNDDPAGSLRFRFDPPDDDAVVQGTELHLGPPMISRHPSRRSGGPLSGTA